MQDNSEETNDNYGLMTTNHVGSCASRASLKRMQQCYPFEQTLNNEIHDSFLDTSVDGWMGQSMGIYHGYAPIFHQHFISQRFHYAMTKNFP